MPHGTYPEILITNLIPATGTTLKVKMGHESTEGSVYEEAKVVVTSVNGLVTKVISSGHAANCNYCGTYLSCDHLLKVNK